MRDGTRGGHAPIGTQRPWRLALALLCLLLVLASHDRLRQRPPVSMRWIHVGFTSLAGVKGACAKSRVNALWGFRCFRA
jgi:hypothetical protein